MLPGARSTPTRPEVAAMFGRLPLSFEANNGQVDPQVRFLARAPGYTVFLTSAEAVMTLEKEPVPAASVQSGHGRDSSQETRAAIPKSSPPSVLRMKLVGANANSRSTGLDELPGRSNYFIGNDPKKWRTNVSNYAKVRYEGVYPGVDLVYHGNQGQLEYDFVVAPGADSHAIKLDVGAEDGVGAGLGRVHSQPGEHRSPLRIDANGDLVVPTAAGEVRLHKPLVYQPAVSGSAGPLNRKSQSENVTFIDGRYTLKGKHRVEFEIPAYDLSKPLVIDPTVSYLAFFGGSFSPSGNGSANGIAVDASGSAYVTGATTSLGFPITGGAQSTYGGGGSDAFVLKLDPTGTMLVYSTYLGGGLCPESC